MHYCFNFDSHSKEYEGICSLFYSFTFCIDLNGNDILYAAELLFHSSWLWLRESTSQEYTKHPQFSCCNVIDDFMDKPKNKNETNVFKLLWDTTVKCEVHDGVMLRSSFPWSKYAFLYSFLWCQMLHLCKPSLLAWASFTLVCIDFRHLNGRKKVSVVLAESRKGYREPSVHKPGVKKHWKACISKKRPTS